jgi:endogenous inhibitor of DNA gyrase (YacG/DUF329 family)
MLRTGKDPESAMAMIFTICPTTGRPVSTGVETDAETFATMPDVISRVICSICGQTHNWSRHNSVLREHIGRPWPKATQ